MSKTLQAKNARSVSEIPLAKNGSAPSLAAHSSMNIHLEPQEKCEGILRIEIPADVREKEEERVVRLFAKQARVPGFRPGKVPAKVIRKRYGDSIDDEVRSALLNKGVHESRKEHNNIIHFLSFDRFEDNDDRSLSIEGKVYLKPSIQLPDYQGLTIEVPRYQGSEEVYEKTIEDLQKKGATFEDLEGTPAEMGHYVVVDYEATKEGVDLKEKFGNQASYYVSRKDSWLLMAEETFLPGFCGELLDKKPGDEVSFDLMLPDNLGIEGLDQEEINYQVKVNAVKKQVLPEVDDEFIKKFTQIETLEAFRDQVDEHVRTEYQNSRGQYISQKIIDYLLANTDFELPPEYVKAETQRQIDQIAEANRERGVEDDKLAEHKKEIVTRAKEMAQAQVKSTFVLVEIAEAENLTIEDEEVEKLIRGQAKSMGVKPAKLIKECREDGRFGNVREKLLCTKTLDFVQEKVTITEVDQSELEEEELEAPAEEDTSEEKS